MEFETLGDLLLHELQDLYSAEQQIIEALPQMAESATSPALKKAFEEHLEQTEEQVVRLEEVATLLDIDLEGKTCEGMEGLLEEGEELMENESSELLDAALIGAAQRVEHYEIAGYGCARTYAELLGNTEVAELLQETLDEEGETDKKLTQIALSELKTLAKETGE